MQRKQFLSFGLGAIALTTVTAYLGSMVSEPANAQPKTTLLVSAAASLQDALKDIDPLFKAANPGVEVNYNFGASGTLQKQIEQGAPADIFISAAPKQMDVLQQQNLLLSNSRRTLLTNRLVLVVPKTSTLKLTSFKQLNQPAVKRIALGEPRSVPAGQYAEEVLRKLGVWDSLKPKFVFGNSVRNVLSMVESGNADAGIVYSTDAKIAPAVKVVATAPAGTHTPIVYPMAVLKASKNPQVARAYLQFLATPKAKAAFDKFGFGFAK
jgi:molybdate transport system substrate-binding protein